MTLKTIFDSFLGNTLFSLGILVLLFVNLFDGTPVLNIICGSLMILDAFWTKHLCTIGKRISSKSLMIVDSLYCLAGMNLFVAGLAKVLGP